jgi:hypothetical protein
VGVGPDEGIGVVDPGAVVAGAGLAGEDALGEIFEIDLVDDADARGDDREGLEGLLAPLRSRASCEPAKSTWTE